MPPKFNFPVVLVAPLDWGLGHATRCIVLIRALQELGARVIIACDGAPEALLRQEFPHLHFLHLEGYHIRYARKKSWLAPALLFQSIKIFAAIRREHRWLEETIGREGVSLVISDNRFGLWTKSLPCIFMTHQLLIKAPWPWLERLIQKINYSYINRFTRCWVPDAPGEKNLGGELSHPAVLPEIPVHYLNLPARFLPGEAPVAFDCCVLLSGPEPQRTVLEEKIIRGLHDTTHRILIVRGLPLATHLPEVPPHVQIVQHLPGKALRHALLQSRYIIARSGYTTIMEILAMRKKSILVPTPGQTEQEYLARHLSETQLCYCINQDDFQLAAALSAAEAFNYHQEALPLFHAEQLAEELNTLGGAN